MTLILSGLYYLSIRLYRGRTLSLGQKSVFDAIIVAISIALGLNIASALKEVAIHTRWWFLSKRHLHIKEVPLLITCTKYQEIHLLISRRLRCIAWWHC
jgi:hypothetical protein